MIANVTISGTDPVAMSDLWLEVVAIFLQCLPAHRSPASSIHMFRKEKIHCLNLFINGISFFSQRIPLGNECNLPTETFPP